MDIFDLFDALDCAIKDFEDGKNDKRPSADKEKQREPKENSQYKVVVNEPAVVLIIGNKKYIAKAQNEPFDEEKGLLMCLAKANGIPFDKVHKMLKDAQRTHKS